jgi:hypothetical protein
LPALFLAALWAAWVSAGPAAAAIYDETAAPSYPFIVNGSANGYDSAYDVVIGSGVTYVAGELRSVEGGADASLMRINHMGWAQMTGSWDSKYHRADVARAVALGPNGTVYTAGYSENAAGKLDMLVIKWSRTGSVLWVRQYDGAAKGDDRATDVAVDRDGNVVVCGDSFGAAGDSDWAVVSWTGAGKRRYAWRYAGAGKGDDIARELCLDKNGNVYVAGVVSAPGPKAALGVAKLTKAGARLWMRTWTGPIGAGASAYAITPDPAGGVFVAGWATAAGNGQDALVARYSPAGARRLVTLMSMDYDTGSDVYLDVTVTTTKKVVAAGYRQAPAGTANQFWTVVAPDGSTSTSWQIATAAQCAWQAVTRDPFGGYVLTGMRGNTGTGIATHRRSTDPEGATWAALWTGPVAAANSGYAVAARGGLVVTVGTQYTGAGPGWDQVALVWVY